MKIKKEIMEQILLHAEKETPIEACGYLMGAEDAITRHYPMTNADGREDHFTFDPNEQFAAHKAARQWGLAILGAYHSHPATPARPSAEDIRLAYDPSLLYVIISLMGERNTTKGFYIKEGIVKEEPLIIEENAHE